MRTILAVCVVALGIGLGPSAYAHHSMAGFDRFKTVTLEGTVVHFKWANPHSWIELEVPNGKGGVDTWNIEMTSPAVLIRAGWKSTTLKPGDKVSIAAHPLMTGEPGGIFVSVTLASGQTMTDKAAPAPTPANP
jgi:hypothetical protein